MTNIDFNNKPPQERPEPSKDQVVHQICDLIRRMPFTSTQLKEIYDSVSGRLISKTCYYCGKVKLQIEGDLVWVDGDMTKPKRFLCADCKEK